MIANSTDLESFCSMCWIPSALDPSSSTPGVLCR